MITERDLLQEIDECQEQPITDKKFERLASCFIVYDHLFGQPIEKGYSSEIKVEKSTIRTNSDSEFLEIVNGKEIELEKATSVEVYLESAGYQMKRIAVELNGEILPKNEYADRMLEDGDCMEVVTFVGGG